MIILEGVDNSGKSTIGEYLSTQLNIPLVHSQRCDASMADSFGMTKEEYCHMHALRQLESEEILRDRVFTISEWIYGNVIRGKSDMGPELHQKAFMELYSRKYLIIYCRPGDRQVLQNGDRSQMEGVLDNHSQLLKAYDQLFNEFQAMGLNIFRYNWTAPGQKESLLKKCNEYLNNYRRHSISTKLITGTK